MQSLRRQWQQGWTTQRRVDSSSLMLTAALLMSSSQTGLGAGNSSVRYCGEPPSVGHHGGGCHHLGLSFTYTRKVRVAQEDCRRQGIAFLPMAAESFGDWHSAAEHEVGKLGAALARHTGQEKAPVGQAWHPATGGKCCHPG